MTIKRQKLCVVFLSLWAMTQPNLHASESRPAGKSYSYQPSAMAAMEQQLKSMLQKKIIDTPPVNPKQALPAIIVNTLNDDIDEAEIDATENGKLRFYEKLVKIAQKRTQLDIRYDGSYRQISYPMGDVAADRGVCTDVVIRSYRSLGIDLQQLVHEDIRANFHLYPSRWKWGLTAPDTNIDHRRVLNLQVFFARYGQSLPLTYKAEDYQPGDLVTWQVSPKLPHIGIVTNAYAADNSGRPLIVHNIGAGPKQDDILFAFTITGHYRYKPGIKASPSPTKPFPVVVSKKGENKADNLSLFRAAQILLPSL